MQAKKHTFRWLLVVLLALPAVMGVKAQRSIRIMEWNVENLFDTRHDTLKGDEAFLPDGEYRWTPYRYWKKLNDVAQTIAATGEEGGLPALVGLCEVENDSVLHDLTCRSALRTAGYQYVMTDNRDHRGVDVALMYQPFMFQLIDWHPVRVPSVENGFSPTRDLLYAKGRIVSNDTLHLVVCHLPSKAGGGSSATRHRRLAVSTLRDVVDSVLAISPDAKMIVMGDFNASFNEKIFKQMCPPLRETLPTSRRELLRPVGTYYFQKQWSYLDHILISDGLWRWQECFSTETPNAIRSHEVRLPFLLTKEGTPNRTYKGPHYNGGISDHLPLVLQFLTGDNR